MLPINGFLFIIFNFIIIRIIITISFVNKSIIFKSIIVQYFIMRKINFVFLLSKNSNNNRGEEIGTYE
jgi:hypothetical protein